MKKFNILRLLSIVSIAAAGLFGAVSFKSSKKVDSKPAEAIDYSSTIRVYVDLDWGNIDYVRLGTDQASGAAVLSSSNAKYNQSLGKYVRDIVDDHTYDKMGCFFSQSSQWWQYQYDGGYVWISGGFKLGYEYQIKSIGYVSESGGVKYFAATPYEIGEITDNVSNPTVYFVDGHSWGDGNVHVHYWGGTASTTFPGPTMSDTGLRLKAFVGETEFSGLKVFKYTISGSVAYLKFNNNSSETGALRPTNGGVYFYGVDGAYEPVVQLLITLQGQMGSYTYKGKSFTSSICKLTQSQASTFVNRYDTLVSTGGSGIASSVPGSGIVTYDTPETSNTHTGEVSLESIRTSLIKKYPAINPSGSNILFPLAGNNSNYLIAVIIVSMVGVASIGGYFFYKKRKEN